MKKTETPTKIPTKTPTKEPQIDPKKKPKEPTPDTTLDPDRICPLQKEVIRKKVQPDVPEEE